MTGQQPTAAFAGLTWDHPRGRDALVAAARQEPGLIHWSTQPLEGFESTPLAQLVDDYDLIVLDHPHLGEAVADDCLLPLEQLFTEQQIQAWQADLVGPALASYKFQGKYWALPLDVANQVMARRADLIPAPPQNFDELVRIAETGKVALSLGGPHALLTLLSFTGTVPGGDDFLDDATALNSFAKLARLFEAIPKGSENLNPIALLETMARSDEVALIPFIFGYVTYARPGDGRHAITFSNSIGDGKGGVLGGTGIGITKRAKPTPELLEHLAWLIAPENQSRFLPAHGGQPASRTAWQDMNVNAAWGNFYTNTLVSAENALLRPRFDGYIDFQTKASARLREALASREAETTTLQALRTLWREARKNARGNLDDERM